MCARGRETCDGDAVTAAAPQDVLQRLDGHALELGELSAARLKVNRALADADREYTAFVDDFETGLWLKAQADGKRLPSQDLRVKLARQAMAPELLGKHDGLVMQRDRIRQRIGDLKVIVDAERSVLSALKTEMEASR